jgi:hypothetical protein
MKQEELDHMNVIHILQSVSKDASRKDVFAPIPPSGVLTVSSLSLSNHIGQLDSACKIGL